MSRALIVHIGMSKAGSTSIQYMLGALSRRLERCGVHVPRAGSGTPGDHHNLPRTTAGRWTAQPGRGAWPELLAEIQASPADRFVLSSEFFTGPFGGAACAARLLELAGAADLDVRLVAYVRPQVQRLESYYGEQVRNADRWEPFETFAAEMLSPAGAPVLDYSAVFAPWRAAFGDALEVYPLERSRPAQGLLVHFLGLLGVADRATLRALGRLRPPRANVRIGAKELEVRRLVARAGSHLPEPARKRLMRRLDLLPALFGDDRPFAGLDAARACAVADRFEASNARFARACGIHPGGVLFRRRAAEDRRRPERAAWADLDARERRLARAHVLARTGVDLEPAATRPPARRDAWRAWWRIGAFIGGRALRLPARWRQLAAARSPYMLRTWLAHTLAGRWR
jgi:hypothetical protein